MTLADNLSGPGQLVVTGPGIVTLTGSDTYTGSTTISGGTLQVGNGGSGASIGGTSGVLDNSVLVFNHGDTVTLSADISGNGSLTQTARARSFSVAATTTRAIRQSTLARCT